MFDSVVTRCVMAYHVHDEITMQLMIKQRGTIQTIPVTKKAGVARESHSVATGQSAQIIFIRNYISTVGWDSHFEYILNYFVNKNCYNSFFEAYSQDEN